MRSQRQPADPPDVAEFWYSAYRREPGEWHAVPSRWVTSQIGPTSWQCRAIGATVRAISAGEIAAQAAPTVLCVRAARRNGIDAMLAPADEISEPP